MTNISQRSKAIVAQRRMQSAIDDLDRLKKTLEAIHADALLDALPVNTQRAFDNLKIALVGAAAQFTPEQIPAEAELTNLWSVKKYLGWGICIRMPDHWNSSLGQPNIQNPLQSDLAQLLSSHNNFYALTLYNGSEVEAWFKDKGVTSAMAAQFKQEIAELLEQHGHPCVILGESDSVTRMPMSAS